MPKFTTDENVVISTDPNNNDSIIKVSYRFSCEACGTHGSISFDSLKISKLKVGKNIELSDSNGPFKCPKCGEVIIIPGGTFILNEKTGEMERTED